MLARPAFTRFAPALLLLVSLCLPVHAAPRWIEIRSPHFRVLSDGSSTNARAAAFQFEQMRSVFATQFPSYQLESGAPLTIFAVRDEQSAKELEGSKMWKAIGSKAAGYFQTGWEKRFALIRLDTFTTGREVVYHEYTHSVLHANAHWLPMWLDEGTAEFYAYTRFEDSRTLLGAPTVRYPVLNSTLIPVKEMLKLNERSANYKDEARMQLFYAESWAMVHFMVFGPNMEGGKKLTQFIHLMDTSTDQEAAFEKVFGDPAAFNRALDNYLHHFTLQAGVIPTNPALDRKAFAERALPPAETAYELGVFHIRNGDVAVGRGLVEQALQLDPKFGAAHEEIGFLNFSEGRDAEARAQWKEAFSLDPNLYRSLYAGTMSGTPLRDQSPNELAATLLALQKVIQINRRFAPAYIEVAMLAMRKGDLALAFTASREAEGLEPWRSGYHVLTGRILLAQGHATSAANFARFVADRWHSSDHDEAVDLWSEIPAADRGPEPALAPDRAPGVEALAGTVTAVDCSGTGKDRKDLVTLQPDGAAGSGPITFDAARSGIGFTDTFWWGEEHFSSCHHLVGDHAVMIFKPHGDAGGDLTMMELRDDPPPPITASPANPRAQATN